MNNRESNITIQRLVKVANWVKKVYVHYLIISLFVAAFL